MGRRINTKAPSPITADDDGLLMFREIAESVAHSDTGGERVITPVSLRHGHKRRAWRKQYQFWLEDDKQDHIALGWWIEGLKKTRTFAPIIRKALALYRELMEGDTTMLYQLFADIKPPPPVPAKKIEEMQQKIDNLQDQVDLLKGILIKQSSPGAVDMTVKMVDRAGERTPRVLSAQPPVIAAVVQEVDTSSAFLDAF